MKLDDNGFYESGFYHRGRTHRGPTLRGPIFSGFGPAFGNWIGQNGIGQNWSNQDGQNGIGQSWSLPTFYTLIDVVVETAIVSFHTLSVELSHCQQSPRILCTRCFFFCSLILDHGVLLIISISDPKILISNILLNTSLHHSFQSVMNRS